MLDRLISQVIAAKEGDTDFILCREAYTGKVQWFAAIGNKSQHVALGEAITYGEDQADFYAEGATPHEALNNLLAKMSAMAA